MDSEFYDLQSLWLLTRDFDSVWKYVEVHRVDLRRISDFLDKKVDFGEKRWWESFEYPWFLVLDRRVERERSCYVIAQFETKREALAFKETPFYLVSKKTLAEACMWARFELYCGRWTGLLWDGWIRSYKEEWSI